MQKETTTLDISGMSCASCANRIEKELNNLSGVNHANVNFALGSSSIEFIPGQITLKTIIKKIEDLGYKAFQKQDHAKLLKRKEEEIQNLMLRFIFSAILSLPLLWSMAGHFSVLSFIWMPDIITNGWLQFALATPIQFIIGYPFYKGAYKALRNKSPDMNLLVAMGTSAAYFYSLFLTIISNIETSSHTGLYFETSAVLITLIILGKFFEAQTKGRASNAIKNLMQLQPQTALVLRNGKEISIPIEEVLLGDIIHVKPGEQIPLDGEVIEGTSFVDESMLTGESIPVEKKIGTEVIGASLNKLGYLKIRVKRIKKDTVLARIIKIVEEAQSSKPPIQRIADNISGIFVPIVIAIAFLTFLLWFTFFSRGNLEEALKNAISVLVIACPCALGLATPTSIMAGSGRAAELGILFKRGEYLETTCRVNSVVLDKTGTITKGEPELTDVLPKDMEESTLLQYVGSVENNSEHSLAEAITKDVISRGIKLLNVETFKSYPGKGIQAVVCGRDILIGTHKLLFLNNINIPKNWLEKMFSLEKEGKTVMLAVFDKEFSGMIAVADTVKDTSLRAISRMKDMGLEVIMITGDNKRTANAVAKNVGIENVLSEVMPDEKAREIKKLQESGKFVAMVGDGINDAPALATSQVGISMGSGTDVAIQTADITLMRNDLNSIADAIIMSKKTMRNIKENLFWALAYNSIGIPIAAMGFLAPWLAGAAMALSSVSVVLNALRLQRVKIKG